MTWPDAAVVVVIFVMGSLPAIIRAWRGKSEDGGEP